MGSKSQALAFLFPIRICHMFLVSKCRRKSDLCLPLFFPLIFVKEFGYVMAISSKFATKLVFWMWSHHCAATFFLQVPEKCADLDLTLTLEHIPNSQLKITPGYRVYGGALTDCESPAELVWSCHVQFLDSFAFGNCKIEPLFEGLISQIHVDFSPNPCGFECWFSGRNQTGDLRITLFLWRAAL